MNGKSRTPSIRTVNLPAGLEPAECFSLLFAGAASVLN